MDIEHGHSTQSAERRPRIVALAGGPGVESLARVIGGLPPDSGLALIVASTGDGVEPALRAATALPVVTVHDGTPLVIDQIHVVPAGQTATLVEDAMHLVPGAGANGSIDRLLRSLADHRGRDAIAVILSGHGSDGLIGLKRIKEVGGVVLTQAPDDADEQDLPRGVLTTGLADVVAPADELPARLVALTGPGATEAGRDATAALRDILTLVRIRSGHDFSNYKRTTVYRRVSRRMQVCGCTTVREYQAFLREHPTELSNLLHDFLISVTSFFRDADAFAALAEQVVPRLFARKAAGEPIRVWVPGCATGEEAYSIGMLLAEHGDGHRDRPIQIFATDIDEEALAEARLGRYPETIAADVPAARLSRFFERDGTHHRVRKELRDLVVFSTHNLLRDPPFSRLDLIACRNLLIYLNRDAQDRVLNLFHFGLRPDAFLFLGASESADAAAAPFTAIDPRHRIFARRSIPTTLGADAIAPRRRPPTPLPEPIAARPSPFADLHHRLVEQYAPPSVLVDDELDIVHVSEHAGRFLAMPGGEPTRQLMKLVVPGLRLDLRSALYAARQAPGGTESRLARFVDQGATRVVEITARVAELPDAGNRMILVLFDERAPGSERTAVTRAELDEGIEPVVRELEDDLHRTRDQLRATIEQYETSLEELRASNEELHSINEELRSASEELESSKEELHAVNEELTALNRELEGKVHEITQANCDLQNLMASTDIGVVFLDRDLLIKRFTPRAQDLINVIGTDLGRPLAHLTHHLDRDDLPELAAKVLADQRGIEREVRARDGRRFLARLLPYRTLANRVEGVVVTFVNVTDRKHAEDARDSAEHALRASEERFRFAVRAAPLIVVSQDRDLRYTWGYVLGAPIDFTGKTDLEAFPPEAASRLTAIKREVLATGVGRRAELELTLGGQARMFDFRFEPIAGEPDAVGVMSVGFDITSSKLAERALRDADRRKDEFLATLSHELRNPLTPLRSALDLQKLAGDDLERIAKARDMMERQVDQLTQLVEDLLDLSRITQNKITLNQRPVPLPQVVSAAVEATHHLVAQLRHRLTVTMPDERLVVVGDFTRLTQILVNLLSNAAKYTPTGGEIALSAIPDRVRRVVVIAVRDNGVGISPELMPRLFEIFVQSRETLARSRNGLGIGLNLVRRLVELHGGTVRAESEGAGRGSQFIVELPLAERET